MSSDSLRIGSRAGSAPVVDLESSVEEARLRELERGVELLEEMVKALLKLVAGR